MYDILNYHRRTRQRGKTSPVEGAHWRALEHEDADGVLVREVRVRQGEGGEGECMTKPRVVKCG